MALTGRITGQSKGVIKNIALFGGSFTASNNADAVSREAALRAASLLPFSDEGKFIWLPEVQNVEDRSESDRTGSLNQGFTTVLVEGRPAYEFKFFADSEYAKLLRGYNGETVKFMEFDSNKKLWGAKNGTSTIGYQAKIKVNGQKIATGQNVEEGVVTGTISILSTTEYFDNCQYIDLSEVDMSAIQVQNIGVLSYVSNSTNAFKIDIYIPTGEANGGENVYDYYADELASASLWEAYTGAKFSTALAITSVAKDATNLCWTVTFDSTAYTALSAGAKIKLNLKAPSVLDAADVTNLAGQHVTLTKA
jgi:hypothetical protein